MPRRARPTRTISPRDSAIATQGAVGARIDAGAGNYSMVLFYNADSNGHPIDVTALYTSIEGNVAGVLGWLQGVKGNQSSQAQHAILNLAAPPIYAYTYAAATDPSNFIQHFGAQNAAMYASPAGVLFRIPAGYSLLVRPRTTGNAIAVSIQFAFSG